LSQIPSKREMLQRRLVQQAPVLPSLPEQQAWARPLEAFATEPRQPLRAQRLSEQRQRQLWLLLVAYSLLRRRLEAAAEAGQQVASGVSP
jgi:hypothetical protein